MATNSNILLTKSELISKLGSPTSNITGDAYLDKLAITNAWGNKVYLTCPNINTVLPDNGEVWPQKQLWYDANSVNQAYISQNVTSVNFRNSNWTIGNTYDIYNSNCYVYGSNNSYAPAGYYMETYYDGNGWLYYKVASTHKITEHGYYQLHDFSWTDFPNNDPSLQLLTSSGTVRVGYSTNETGMTVDGWTLYSLNGQSSGSTDSYLTASINSSPSGVNLRRTNYNSQYPFTVVTIKGTHFGGTYYHYILVAPEWTLTSDQASYQADVNGETITPTINTNMGSYTMSSDKDWAEVYIEQGVWKINVDPNIKTQRRDAIITVSSNINITRTTTGWTNYNFNYNFSKDTRFTVWQEPNILPDT